MNIFIVSNKILTIEIEEQADKSFVNGYNVNHIGEAKWKAKSGS